MFAEFSFSIQNILDNQGIGIAITGMSIVFLALTLITGFIASLPRILSALEGVLPPEHDHHATATAGPPRDDEALAAAIGFALHTQSQHKS